MSEDDALYKHLLDNLSTAILLLDSRLRVTYINPAAEDLLQVSASRVVDCPLSEIFSEQGTPLGKPLQILIETLQSGTPLTKRQAQLRLPSPQEITVDYTITPIDDETHSLIMEIQPLDRILRISREKNLLSSQKTTQMLVRGLAHEIKNPLGGIRGAAQLLARELPSDELRDYTEVIIAESDRLRNLVDKMLGSHKAPAKNPVNIHEVLERVATLIEAESQGGVTLERDYDPSIPELIGDKEKLIQAILNIMRNAMQILQGQNNACITLRTRTQRQFTIGNARHRLVCRIDIIDNGAGIPASIIDNIFFPMVSGRAEGTGLGLSISQSLINQHNGLIKCESEPGKTVFSLFLPLDNMPANSPAHTPFVDNNTSDSEV